MVTSARLAAGTRLQKRSFAARRIRARQRSITTFRGVGAELVERHPLESTLIENFDALRCLQPVLARHHGVHCAADHFARDAVGWTGEGLVRFRSRALGLLRRRWHVLTLATLAGHLTVFVLLLACLRTVGVGAADSWGRALHAPVTVAVSSSAAMTPISEASRG